MVVVGGSKKVILALRNYRITPIKRAFLTEKHLRFNLYENGPSFTFQCLLKQFQANFLLLYPLKGTTQ